MPDEETAGSWRGHELIDRDGERIGKIEEVFRDRHSEEPEWVTVKSGLLGKTHFIVPIREATSQGDIVRVPYDKEQVEGSPEVDPDSELSDSEERELYAHYGIEHSGGGEGGGEQEHET